MNTDSSPGSLKSTKLAKQAEGGQLRFGCATQGRRRNAEQCSSDAVSDRVDFPIGHNGTDRVERLAKTQLQIVLETHVAIAAVGFFHEIINTVWPCSTRYRTREFCADRSRM